jgi:hypothetical protein
MLCPRPTPLNRRPNVPNFTLIVRTLPRSGFVPRPIFERRPFHNHPSANRLGDFLLVDGQKPRCGSYKIWHRGAISLAPECRLAPRRAWGYALISSKD